MPNTRIVNLHATCAKCGEVLDTNEASIEEIASNGGYIETEFVVGTDHECYAEALESYIEATQGPSAD